MKLAPLSLSVVADLSGIKAIAGELAVLGRQGRTTGQEIGRGLAAGAKESSRAFEEAGDKAGKEFGSGIARGAGGSFKKVLDPLAGEAEGSGQKAGRVFGKGFSEGLKGSLSNVLTGVGQGIGQSLVAGLGGALGALKDFATNRDAYMRSDGAKAGLKSLGADVADLESRAKAATKELKSMASTTELLASSYDIVSSGFSGADAIKIATTAKKAAVASPDQTGATADTAVVGDAMTSVLNAYKLSAADADKVAAQMIGTVNAGKIKMGQYASTIGQVASVAAESGVALHEMNGVIAAATVAGVPAESAIAGLKASLAAISKPTGEAAELASSVGLNFNAAALRSKGFIGVLKDIKDAGLGTSDGIYKLFGSTEAWTALSPVIGKLGEDYEKIEDTVKGVDLDKAFEDGSKSAARLQDKLAALKEEFDLKFQTAVAPIFEAGTIALTQLLSHLNEGGVLFEGLNQAAINFRDFLAQNPAVITAISVAFAELLNGGVLMLQEGILNLTNALRENPQLIQQLVTNLAGAVTAAVQFAQGMGQAFGFMGQLLAPLSFLVTALTGAGGASQGIAQTFGQIAAWVVTLGGGLSIVSSVIGVISGVAGAVSGIAAALGTTVAAIGAALAPIALALAAIFVWVENIKNYSANWNEVLLAINYTWGEMVGWLGAVFNAIGQSVQQSNLFKNLWELIAKVVQFLIKPYQDLFGLVGQLVQKSESFRALWDGVKSLAQTTGAAFNTFVGGVLDSLTQKAQQLFGWIQKISGMKGGDSSSNSGGGGASATIAGVALPPQIAAFIEMVRVGEGTEGDKGFTTIFTGKQFQGFGDHPRQLQSGGGFTSDAAGMGQFLSTTWDEVAAQIGAKDFSPENQVKGIVQLIKNRGAYEDLMAGNLDAALSKTSHEWASLPTGVNASAGRYGQPAKTGAEASRIYQEKLAQMQAGGTQAGGIPTGGGASAGQAGKVIVNRTGQLDENGLEKLMVRAFDRRGNLTGSFVANSGIRSTQGNFGQPARDVSGTNNPLPYGDYSIGPTVSAAGLAGYGKETTLLEPQFKTARAGIEAHVDGNRATSPGSAGCLVFASEQEFAAFLASVKASGADTLRFEEATVGLQQSLVQQLPEAEVQRPSNTLAAPPPNKNDETQAMAGAVELARKKEDSATKLKREEAARTLKQTREDQKLQLDGQKAALVSPDAKDAHDRAIKEIEVRAQYEDRLLDLQQKRDDLATARDRKKKDAASPDSATAAAAKALPDFTAQINAYDKLIAKDKELQAQALKNISIGDETKQAEAERTSAIQRRNTETERAAELERTVLQGRLEAAQRSNPLEAAAIESQIKRRDLQVALNKEVQVELDKLSEVERALAELAKIGQQSSPQAKRLQSERQGLLSSTAARQATSKAALQNFDAEDGDRRQRLNRDREAALLDKDRFLAEPKSKARADVAGQMRRQGNVEGALRLEKENALIQLGLSYRAQQLELEAKIADLRSRGVELSEQEVAGYRQSLEMQQQFDLSSINRQFDAFQSEILPSVQESVGGFFKSLLDGSKSAGEAFNDMLDNIISKILDFAVNQIVSSLFGGLFGGGGGGLFGGGGGGGGGIMSIFGFAAGGIVSGANTEALRRQPGPIGEALRREGSNSVLSALTPGEMVLSVAQTQAFLASPMARDVLNFKGGGLVPGGGGSASNRNTSTGPSVNIALNVAAGGGSGGEVDYGVVAKMAKNAATAEINRQQKPRGSLAR
jgi:TP901 family phage tail tape measure protein